MRVRLVATLLRVRPGTQEAGPFLERTADSGAIDPLPHKSADAVRESPR